MAARGPKLNAEAFMSLHPFSYIRPRSMADAVEQLARPDAFPLGGGTDLLTLIQDDLAHPAALVDLRAVPGARDITAGAGRGLRIGAAARVHDIAQHARVKRDFPALAQACEAVGTTALRHMGTIGGNLCQRPRCWYFRGNVPCYKSGVAACPAEQGENQYLAILGGGPCWAVHPSDPAVALTALAADVEIVSARGTRRVPISEFYTSPAHAPERETVLEPGEIVAAIELNDGNAGGWQRYEKLMQRAAWDFALVSLAAVRTGNGDIRLVMGGVAPAPWRVASSVEEDISSGALDPDDVATLADRALYDARPLAKNSYKLALAGTLLRRAIADLSAT